MYKIVKKERLNPTVTQDGDRRAAYREKSGARPVHHPARQLQTGERIPLTIADYDREKGTVTIIFQKVGATTMALGALNEGDCLHDFVGPLGDADARSRASRRSAVVGGGVGCAIALPVGQEAARAWALRCTSSSASATRIIVILEDEFKAACDQPAHHDRRRLATAKRALVTAALKQLIEAGNAV